MFIATVIFCTKVAIVLDISKILHVIPWKCTVLQERHVVLKSEDIILNQD